MVFDFSLNYNTIVKNDMDNDSVNNDDRLVSVNTKSFKNQCLEKPQSFYQPQIIPMVRIKFN